MMLPHSQFTRSNCARPLPAAVRNHPGRRRWVRSLAQKSPCIFFREQRHVDRSRIGLSKFEIFQTKGRAYHVTGISPVNRSPFSWPRRPAVSLSRKYSTLKYVMYNADPLGHVATQYPSLFVPLLPTYRCHPSTNAASERLDHTQKHRTHRPESTLGGGTRGPRCEAVTAVLKLIIACILDTHLQQLSHGAGVVETDCLIGLGQ